MAARLYREKDLSRLAAKVRRLIQHGAQIEAITAEEVYCPRCHSPMVDSELGRLAHTQRSPGCESALKEKVFEKLAE